MDPKSIPAFPQDEWNNDAGEYMAAGGMSLRDYFAAKAMQGMCAHPETWGLETRGIPAMAYALADEMLLVRATPPQSPSASGNVGEEK